MRFFTRAWHTGDLPEQDSERILQDYQEHLRAIASRVPARARTLAEKVSLHDALVRAAEFDAAAQRLVLRLRAGDQQVGYFDLDLSYAGCSIRAEDLAILQSLSGSEDTELLSDELDEEDGGFVHRLLFWPEGEASIPFRDLQWSKTNQPGRFAS